MTKRLRDLSAFDLAVLELLPVEPAGESLAALALELLRRWSPRERGQVAAAIRAIEGAVGPVRVSKGMDGLARPAVRLYALRRRALPRVRRFFANTAPKTPRKGNCTKDIDR